MFFNTRIPAYVSQCTVWMVVKKKVIFRNRRHTFSFAGESKWCFVDGTFATVPGLKGAYQRAYDEVMTFVSEEVALELGPCLCMTDRALPRGEREGQFFRYSMTRSVADGI